MGSYAQVAVLGLHVWAPCNTGGNVNSQSEMKEGISEWLFLLFSTQYFKVNIRVVAKIQNMK